MKYQLSQTSRLVNFSFRDCVPPRVVVCLRIWLLYYILSTSRLRWHCTQFHKWCAPQAKARVCKQATSYTARKSSNRKKKAVCVDMLQQHTSHISVLFRSISPERTFIGLIYTVGVSAGFYGLARLEQLKPGRAAFENSAAASSRLRVLVQYDITFLPEVISTNYNEHTLRRAVITGNLVLAIGKSFSMRVDDRPLGRKRCERT